VKSFVFVRLFDAYKVFTYQINYYLLLVNN